MKQAGFMLALRKILHLECLVEAKRGRILSLKSILCLIKYSKQAPTSVKNCLGAQITNLAPKKSHWPCVLDSLRRLDHQASPVTVNERHMKRCLGDRDWEHAIDS